MPEKFYQIVLDEKNSIFVYVETAMGKVTAFVVKYLAIIDDEEFEILRYDSGHGVPHIDILDPQGKTMQKIWLSDFTFKEALVHAKKDIKEHYQLYRERFILWKNVEEQ
ncbi:MAG: hypothetical protein HY961_00560 [Ignavibacteriae bacterium]|nr:hypothetical protein [Ignavibacteriota bacterium]